MPAQSCYFGEAKIPCEVGFVFVAVAAILLGSYGVPMKTERIMACTDPRPGWKMALTFEIYAALGMAAVSFLTLAYNEFVFTWWGFLAAAMWVPAQVVTFISVHSIGYAATPAITTGISLAVSFFLEFALSDASRNYIGSFSSLVLLACAAAGAAASVSTLPRSFAIFICGEDSSWERAELIPKVGQEGHHANCHHTNYTVVGAIEEYKREQDRNSRRREPSSPLARGLMCSTIAGLMNGALFVPFRLFEQQEAKMDSMMEIRVGYVGSFAIGVLAVSPVFFALCFSYIRKRPRPMLSTVALPGIASGVMWGVGHVAWVHSSLYLSEEESLSLLSVAIIISGLWGVVYYKELHGPLTLTLFAFSLALLLAGSVCLALFG